MPMTEFGLRFWTENWQEMLQRAGDFQLILLAKYKPKLLDNIFDILSQRPIYRLDGVQYREIDGMRTPFIKKGKSYYFPVCKKETKKADIIAIVDNRDNVFCFFIARNDLVAMPGEQIFVQASELNIYYYTKEQEYEWEQQRNFTPGTNIADAGHSYPTGGGGSDNDHCL